MHTLRVLLDILSVLPVNLEDPYRLFRCPTIMDCVDACPKILNPIRAIGKIKDMRVKRTV